MEGYTLLEYIESNGSQWIDTSFIPNSNSRVVLDFKLVGKTTNRGLFGTRGAASSYTNRFCFWCLNGVFRTDYGTNNKPFPSEIDIFERHTVDKNKSETTLDGNYSLANTTTTYSSDYPLYIFACNEGGKSSLPTPMQLYSCQIYDNDTLIRDYVPCMDNNGVYGLYDKVNGLFYASATDSGFTGKWAENKTLNVSMSEYRHRMLNLIPKTDLPKGYFRCEYIESDGTNFIDTGFKPNQDTKVILDIDCPIDTGNTSKYIFGTDSGSSSKGAFSLSTYLGKYQSYYNTSGALSFENNGANRMTIVKDKQHTYCNDTLVASATYASFQSDYSAYMFCSNRAGSSYNATSLKLYSCQIYDNGVKVRDYVPCVSPDGYFGLYDLVTNEFYRLRTGNSTLTIGRGKVILPSGYANAEYIAGDGNAWIDTGYFPNGNTKVVMDAQMNSYTSGLPAFFGAFGTSNKNSFAFLDPTGGSNYYAYYYGSSDTTNNKITAGMFDRGLIIADKGTANYHGTIVSLADASFTSTNTLYLFCGNENGTLKYNASMRLYQCQIHDNGTFTKFFIPCEKDEIFGLYEMFEGIFYSSEGSSEFTGESDGDNEGSGSLPDYSSYRGVYIEDVDGCLYTESEWDGSKTANGIAVLTDNCRFVMALNDAPSDDHRWSGYVGLVNGVTIAPNEEKAISDYDGQAQTAIIVSSLKGVSDGSIVGAPAAEYCQSFVFPNGQSGYLAAAGEWFDACNNKSKIWQAIRKCGGTVPIKKNYWTSTQSGESWSWMVDFDSLIVDGTPKATYGSVRPFTPLKSDRDSDDVVTISFTINGVGYQAEEGMSWQQWVNSSYNTDGYNVVSYDGGNTCIMDATQSYRVLAITGVAVLAIDTIKEGSDYKLYAI